jgi:predicted ATPase
MTLTALRLAQFKAFGSSQRVPLRPITLVYGANSAGKSSILHALALAHHAIETGELDTQRTQIGGDSIDLGGFRQYVHRRERERQVELGFEIDPGGLSGRVAELLRSASAVVVELAIGAGFTSEQKTLFGDRARELDPGGGARVERFSLEVDGAPLLAMSARAGGLLRLDRLDHAHPVFRELFRGLLMLATTTQRVEGDDFAALGEVLDALVPTISARTGGLFPRIEEESGPGETEALSVEELVPVSRGRRSEDLARAARLFLPRALRELVGGLGAALEGEIRRLRYLGPLRSYPPRHLAFSQHHDPNWFAGGGHAWDVVRTREDVRRRVNTWLGDATKLMTPYDLQVRDLVPAVSLPAELSPKLLSSLHDLARELLGRSDVEDRSELLREAVDTVRQANELGLEDEEMTLGAVEELVSALIDTDEITARWAQEVVASRAETLQDLVLIDKRSGTPVSHRDVGIGVSQVLPVLVSAYASKDKLLAIEQPEIHLHPALQAELGDVFLDAALTDAANTVLIETHSEHLLLRIMRRMLETFEERLPDGVPEVRPEHVMVLFVEPDGARSIVREMPLNERGELVKAWPGGFFEEGLREVF